jgi:hypothetical protein
MGHQPKHPFPEKMEYPKFQFLLLNLLGERDFVRKAKQEIDAINHLRTKEWRNPTPPKGGTGQIGGSHTHSYPERGRKFDINDIYLLDDAKGIEKFYNKNNLEKIINYNIIEIDTTNLSLKEAEAAILHERIHFLESKKNKAYLK